jgi:CBS-domain-containing membrane protein
MTRQPARLFQILGIELSPVTHTERLISTAGGFLAIYSILLVSTHFIPLDEALLIVASMGASAVLLFAVPHGPLAQPWPVAGGHLVSAAVGVTCAQLVPDTLIASALAVGLAIGAMHYLRCIHPPGGATALSAVLGGPAIHNIGYQYILTPVALNVVVILGVAFLFNYPFAWRRYPAALKPCSTQRDEESYASIAHEDLVYALAEVNSFIDISERDLLTIYDLATHSHSTRSLDPDTLEPGGFYSNGKYGPDWAVRQIIDESRSDDPDKDLVIYKTVAGKGLRHTGFATRREFANWAKHEVYRDDENWRRKEDQASSD